MENAFKLRYKLGKGVIALSRWDELFRTKVESQGHYVSTDNSKTQTSDFYIFMGGVLIRTSYENGGMISPSNAEVTLGHLTLDGLEKMAQEFGIEFDREEFAEIAS